MNEIVLRGFLRDIEFSHNQGDIEYEKANLICPRIKGCEEDVISIKYKKFVNKYKEGDFVELKGNLRSYSTKIDGHNSVQIYVFTYFDLPEEVKSDNVIIDGRICWKDSLRYYKNGKAYLHFTLANNIFTNNGKKINNYIPCTAFGETALKLDEYDINTFLNIVGEFHSHTYKKYLEDNEIEYRIAHDVTVNDFEVIDG